MSSLTGFMIDRLVIARYCIQYMELFMTYIFLFLGSSDGGDNHPFRLKIKINNSKGVSHGAISNCPSISISFCFFFGSVIFCIKKLNYIQFKLEL